MNVSKTPPPSRPKTPRPVESFGPEILSALMKGATDGLTLEMPFKLAVRFRLRIHQMRESMRRSGHEKYNLVARVRVQIAWPEDTPVSKQGRHSVPVDRNVKCKVTLRPNDTEFADLLQKAGVDPLDAVSSDDLPETQSPKSDLSSLDDMLKDLQ